MLRPPPKGSEFQQPNMFMEIFINKDIRKYKVKDVGPFTLGQVGGLTVAAIMGYGVYYLEKHFLHLEEINDLQIFSILIAAMPGIAFGFIKPYGLSFYKFLKTVFFENFVNPKVRIYESDFDFSESLADQPQEDVMSRNIKYTKEEKAELKKWKSYK